MDDRFERLKAFILKQSWLGQIDLTRDTLIEEDLGITGDDAIEFIIAYSEYCQVDISNFLADKYFRTEGGFWPILRLFLKGKKSRERSLTVGDLENGIIHKKLDEDIINAT